MVDTASAMAAELQSSSTHIDEWCSMQENTLTYMEVAHSEAMASAKEEIQLLKCKDAALKTKLTEVSDVIRSNHEKESQVLQEIGALKIQENALPQEIDVVKQSESEALQKTNTIKAELEKIQQTKENETKELTKGIAFYKRLGMDFKRVGDDRLCLIFTQIDPACPEREFSFTIKVDHEDAYQVESCEPPVEGIADHLECLNTTNDFSAFVRIMRRAFKAQAGQ